MTVMLLTVAWIVSGWGGTRASLTRYEDLTDDFPLWHIELHQTQSGISVEIAWFVDDWVGEHMVSEKPGWRSECGFGPARDCGARGAGGTEIGNYGVLYVNGTGNYDLDGYWAYAGGWGIQRDSRGPLNPRNVVVEMPYYGMCLMSGGALFVLVRGRLRERRDGCCGTERVKLTLKRVK